MAFSMSGGQYSYNRFDEYQRLLEKKHEDEKREDEDEKKSKKSGDKKADKDYDGDGEVESSSEEYLGSRDKAIKKAMGKEDVKEASSMNVYVDALSRMSGMYHPMDTTKDVAPEVVEEEKVKQAKKMSEKELEKGLDKGADTHKEAFMAGYEAALSEAEGAGSPAKMAASVKKEADSNKKETDAMAYASKKQRRSQAVNAAEEFVMNHLIDEGLANNEVSAETIMLHMSDEWYEAIIAEMGPAYPSETKAQAKAQSDHREGKSSAGEKTGKNPGLKASHSSGANRQD